MEQLHQRYPDDDEAAAFYALALQATADPNDKSYAKQRKSGRHSRAAVCEAAQSSGRCALLDPCLRLSGAGSACARRCAPLWRDCTGHAACAAHAVAHVHCTGLWEDSIQSNLAANAAAKNLGWVQEELHTMDYLVYAYLQSGQGARRSGREKSHRGDRDSREAHIGHGLRGRCCSGALCHRAAALGRCGHAASDREHLPATVAITHYVRALGAARIGEFVAAQKDVDKLGEIRDALSKVKQDYWAKQVEIQRQTAAAWVALAKGDGKEAVKLMRAAAELEDSSYKNPVMPAYILPARELLGDMLLELQQPAQALVEYETSLRAVPNRFNGLYGAAQAAQNAHDQQKAKHYYSELLRICSKGDGERPELKRAQLYLASL
jgi:tetratricopeptide (TPR) repeat protein